MKPLRALLALVLSLQFTLAPTAGAQALPYRLVDPDQCDIFREEQQARD